MSVPMEWDKPATEAVPLDLTMNKEDNIAVSEAGVKRDGPAMEDAPLSQSDAQNDVESTPLNLRPRKVFPFRPVPMYANVAQYATVAALSPKAQFESSPQPQYEGYWIPASPSPMMATEHSAPLHGMYADAAAYQHLVMSSADVPEYNPYPPILPTSAATQFPPHNHVQHQLQHLQMQKQQLISLQHHLYVQQKLQLQLHQFHNQQKLQLQATYGAGVPLDPVSMMSSSPVHTATSSAFPSEFNHFPSPTTYDYYHFHHQQQQQQRDLDREHRQLTKACATDDTDVVNPEEVAAIYRQSDFLSFRHQYMVSLGSPIDDNTRRPSNDNSSSSSSSSSNSSTNVDDLGPTPGQHQYDQTYVTELQRSNEAAKRSRDAKRQKYVDNHISVLYLTKKVREMKDIKKRLQKTNSNILAD